MQNLYQKITELQHAQQKSALCIVIHTKGSAPQKAGAKMVVGESGETWGSIGGGALEYKVIQDAFRVIRTGKPGIFRHALLQDHEMCCGGSVELYIEPVEMKTPLYIFGAGHIGQALAEIAGKLEFSVTIIDEREDRFAEWHPSSGIQVMNQDHRTALEALTFGDDAFIAVVTHNHAYDKEIVAACLDKPYAYLGMIGSARKVEIARKRLLAAGASEERLNGIDWPMGLKIGAKTPHEIAVSIIAKWIEVRANRKFQTDTIT